MTYKELYRIIVIELHFEPTYFFDSMSIQELNLILSNYDYRFRSNLENTRTLAYIEAQANSRKRLKPSDIMSFRWDNETKETKPKMNKKQLEAIKAESEEITKILNKK